MKEGLSFPLNLSSLERMNFKQLYLPPGASSTEYIAVNLPNSSLGVLFILSDPLLDPCPRTFASAGELQAEAGRHIIYYGK